MPSGSVVLMAAALGAVLYVGDKVAHVKPIAKANHAICRVVTLGKKCKPIQGAKPHVR